MKCHGKCFLSKKLKEQQKRDDQSSNTRQDKSEFQLYFLPDETIYDDVIISYKKKYAISNDELNSFYFNSVFHPPSV